MIALSCRPSHRATTTAVEAVTRARRVAPPWPSERAPTPPFQLVRANRAATCAIDVDRNLWCWGAIGDQASSILNLRRDGLAAPRMVEIPGLSALRGIVARAVIDAEVRRSELCFRSEPNAPWTCRNESTPGSPLYGTIRTLESLTSGANHGWDDCDVIDDELVCALDGADEQRLRGFVAAARTHRLACAISAGGEVRCANDGQSPTMLASLARGVAVAQHATSIVANEQLICWSTTTPSVECLASLDSPGAVQVQRMAGFHSLVATAEQVCALSSQRSLRCWSGFDAHGDPLLVPTPVSEARSIAAGALHVCAIRMDQTLRCWGEESWGRLGPSASYGGASEIAMHTLPAAIRDVRVSDRSTCALLADGRVYCWGFSGWGATGQRSQVPIAPTLVIERLRTHGDAREVPLGVPARSIESYGAGTCAQTASGPRCWGGGDATPRAMSPSNAWRPTSAARAIPRSLCAMDHRVCAFEPRITEDARVLGVVSGATHSCAWTTRNEVTCWGDNRVGQLGAGAVGLME